MANVFTYSLHYTLNSPIGPYAQGEPDNTTSFDNQVTISVEIQDLDLNGMASPGDRVGLVIGAVPRAGTHFLYGFTSAGDPIVALDFLGDGSFYQALVLSNTPGLTGNVGYTTSGTYDFTCFAAGTLIATPMGEMSVEDLQPGARICTQSGGLTKVLWIGKQTGHKLQFGAKLQPVRIRAGALGGGLPHSDLTVTADHGMVLDGYVINASALVNGDTINFVPMDELEDSFTVYHIETEAHDVILANGAPSETFVDAAGRAAFDNHQEYLDLYGVERIIPEMDRPRICSARLVPQGVKKCLGIHPMPLPADGRQTA